MKIKNKKIKYPNLNIHSKIYNYNNILKYKKQSEKKIL